MQKEDLLKQIAEKGYDVGFGAKKHFATLDMIEKIPSFVGFITLIIGIMALYNDFLTTKDISMIMIGSSIAALRISLYNSDKNKYDKQGTILTNIFNELKSFYYQVKSDNYIVSEKDLKKLKDISDRYYGNSISKQILFSGWLAHYKFFWEHQINWIDEQLNFTFWKDKIPVSMKIFFIFFIVGFIIYFFDECILKIDIVNEFLKGVSND